MKIRQEGQKGRKAKKEKKHDVHEKRHIVEYYLLRLYSKEDLLKKYNINSILLLQWLSWYYKYFHSQYFTRENYGKGKVRKADVKRADQGAGIRVGNKGGSPEKSKHTEPGSGDNAEPGTEGFSGSGRTQIAKKKHWTKIVEQLKEDYPESSLEELCRLFDRSRQAWYKSQHAEIRNTYEAEIIVEEVKRIREHLPKSGGRKLYHLMAGFLKKEGIKIGRDKFFEVLNKYNLLIKRKKRTRKTTNSNHHFRRYPNITEDMEIVRPNQLWVSDITYVRLPGTFCYLSLVTDAYSRKIVGWHLAEDLKAESTLKALEMALENLPQNHKPLVHHSDRGLQYCSKMYVELLRKHKIKISMTEKGDPYENILAERINRTIKEEFIEMYSYVTYEEALAITGRSVTIYNSYRPHASLDYLTPDQAHRMRGELKKRWKNYNDKQTAPVLN